MMIRVKDTNVCKSCLYGSEFSDGCTYLLIHRKSRLIENGERYDPAYCTKYQKGTKEVGEMLKIQQRMKRKEWKNGKYF